jgi:hypothetical protein
MIFLCWAWYDSLIWRNSFSHSHNNYVLGVDSSNGGLSFYSYDNKYEAPFTTSGATSGFHHIRNNDPKQYRKFNIKFQKPEIHYITIILTVLFFTTAWLTWRWRKAVAALSQCHANP